MDSCGKGEPHLAQQQASDIVGLLLRQMITNNCFKVHR